MLQHVFGRAAIGDFSEDVELYETEDEFTETFVGVQIMLEVIRQQMAEMNALNAALENKIRELEREMKRRADEENRKDDFIAILGHELRNPLAPVTYAAQLMSLKLSDGSATQAELLENTSIIERQSTHMARLINDLLDMSRILRGKLDLKLATIDLSTVVEHAVETTRPLIQEKQHALTLTLPRDEIIMEADPLRLEQAIVNILNNAAKYTPRGGKIDVAVFRKDEHAHISIRDSGVGIPQSFIDKIFNIFSREYYTSMTEGGLGIGLTVAKGVALLHKGDISVSSEGRNKGTELLIRLPIYQPTEGAVPLEKNSAERWVAHNRVLIVDDNVDHAITLSRMLEHYGQEVRAVTDGTSALRIIPTFKPQVVFLDLSMPDMDGFEVARQFRESEGSGLVRLVALTGFGQKSDFAKTRAAGFDAHLIKPPKIEEILEVLR